MIGFSADSLNSKRKLRLFKLEKFITLTIFLSFFFLFSSTVSAENLLSNPSFKSSSSGQPTGWDNWGGTFSATSSPVSSGSQLAKFVSTTTSTKYVYQTVPASPSGNYNFSTEVFKPDEGSSVYLRISWYASSDGRGSILSSTDSASVSTVTSDFQRLTIDAATAPINAYSANAKLMLDPMGSAQTIAYFDNVVFELTTEPEPPPEEEPSASPDPPATPPTEATGSAPVSEPEPEQPLAINFSPPLTAEIGTSFDLTVNVTHASPLATYYVKSLSGPPESTSPSGGYTFNPETNRWLPTTGGGYGWDDFPTFTTNVSGSATFILRTKAVESDSVNSAREGQNNLLIRLRQVGTNTNLDSLPQTVNLTAPPPTTDNQEEPSSLDANQISTPTAALTISLSLPTKAIVGAEFEIEVNLTNAAPLTSYSLKFRAGPENGKPSKGQTFNGSNPPPDDWLSDSDGWAKFPVVSTNEIGHWSGKLKVRINEKAEVGRFLGSLRIRKVVSSTNHDSTNYSFETTPPVEIPEEGVILGAAVTSIAGIRSQPDNTTVSLEGIVTAPSELLGKGVLYLQDETGGIMIKLPSKSTIKLDLGDRVRVGCQIKTSRGERYIDVDESSEVTLLGKVSPTTPKQIPTTKVNETYEGQLVKIRGTVAETKGDTFYLDDGSGRTKVYIKESTGIDKPKMKKGQVVEVTGIVSQYENKDDPGYRLLPRYQTDIKILPVTGPPFSTGLPLLFLGVILKAATMKIKDQSVKCKN